LHHEAVAAVDPRDGLIVGVGRYVRDREQPAVAEVAFEVADELQGMGIGTALATHIVQHARANCVALLTAATLWDNRPALALLRRFGFRARASCGGVIELDLELDSPSVADWRRGTSGSGFDAPHSNDGTRQTRPGGSDAVQLLARKESHGQCT
jgi:protein lysine acetyltransferase